TGVDQLDDAIAMREVTQTLEDHEELWDAPLLYATIVLGLTAEWVLRKWFRMVWDPPAPGSAGHPPRAFNVTIATEIPSARSFRDEQMVLRSRLARLRLRLCLEMALEFALEAAALIVGTGVVLVFLDWWFRLGQTARLALLIPALISVV